MIKENIINLNQKLSSVVSLNLSLFKIRTIIQAAIGVFLTASIIFAGVVGITVYQLLPNIVFKKNFKFI